MNTLNYPELQDDAQASVLYSHFRDKSVNPTSWNRKMTFWQSALLKSATERGEVTFTAHSLPKFFERKGITPKCLQTVIEEMERCGTVKPLTDYGKDEGWMSWCFHTLLKQPLTWGAGRLLGSPKKSPDMYVWPHMVQKMCQTSLELLQAKIALGQAENVMYLSEARDICKGVLPLDQDFRLIFAQLERDKAISTREIGNGVVLIKCLQRTEASAAPIKETDVQLHKIKFTRKRLEKEITELSSRIDRCIVEAKVHVHEKRKSRAMWCLREKKRAITSQERKSSHVLMLEDIIQKIEEASTNELILEACKAGSRALQAINADQSVGSVDSVMDSLHEALDDQEDISQALSAGLPTHTEDDSDDLDKELDELLAGDSIAVLDEEDKLIHQMSTFGLEDFGLPDVPKHSPNKNSQDNDRLSKPVLTEPLV